MSALLIFFAKDRASHLNRSPSLDFSKSDNSVFVGFI